VLFVCMWQIKEGSASPKSEEAFDDLIQQVALLKVSTGGHSKPIIAIGYEVIANTYI